MSRVDALQSRLANLLPLLLLALLAAFSWWVAQEALLAIRPQARPGEPQTRPDYVLENFQARNYGADGQLTSQVSGSAMRHIPGDQTIHITAPLLHAHSAADVVLDASARDGISNADGSNVQLLGSAVVTRSAPGQPDLIVRGEFLNIFPQQQQLSTDRPSTIERDGSLMQAQQLQVDALTGQVTMRGQVRTLLPPPRQHGPAHPAR